MNLLITLAVILVVVWTITGVVFAISELINMNRNGDKYK